MKKANLTKYEFKVCEAVVLDLTHYYMGPKDKRPMLQKDYEVAYELLPKLPKGWMQDQYDWQIFTIRYCNKKRRKSA